MAFGGRLVLKSLSLFLRIIQFLCAALILAVFSYFLATLHNHNFSIATYVRAVTGISGAGVLYTIFALLLVCCLGGITFFGFIAMVLDVAFAGAFAYVAYANRDGKGSCNGQVNTVFGPGNTNGGNQVVSPSNGITWLPSYHTACRLETACFAVAIVAAVFFLLSVPLGLALIRHHKKEKAFGPSPNNGYTAGSPRRRFWQRKQKNTYEEAKNPDALPTHATPADFRTSYATESTAVGRDGTYDRYNAPGVDMIGGTNVPYGAHQQGYTTTTTTRNPAF